MWKRFHWSVLVAVFLAQSATASEANFQNLPDHLVSATIRYRLKPNDSPSSINFLPIPYLTYLSNNFLGPNGSIEFQSSAVYNLLKLRKNYSNNWFSLVMAEGDFVYAGDTPRIDGDNFTGLYNFKGHRYGGGIGFGRYWSFFGEPYRSTLSYRFYGHHFFDRSSFIGYIPPSNFYEHGPNFRFEPNRNYVHEIRAKPGFRPSLDLSYWNRGDFRPWGTSQARRNAEAYFKGEIDIDWLAAMSPRWGFSGELVAGYVSDADRVNALIDGRARRRLMGKFLQDVRSDWSVSGHIGPKIFLDNRKKVAIRPYGFGAGYRELTLVERRIKAAGGGGLSLMGLIRDNRFAWDFNYGLVSGIHEEKSLIHEFSALISYQFWP